MIAEVGLYCPVVGYSVYDEWWDSMYPWRTVMSEQDRKGKVGGYIHERDSAVCLWEPTHQQHQLQEAQVEIVDSIRYESWLFGHNLAYILPVGLQMEKCQVILLIYFECDHF